MNLKTIEGMNAEGRKILVRADFNVELDDQGKVKEYFKIKSIRETVDALLKRGASHVALLSHFGRPDGKYDAQYSLKLLVNEVSQILEREVYFVSECVGEKVQDAMRQVPDGSVLLLENVRFSQEEEANDIEFARKLAKPFDMFVNDAFSVCHRAHASVSAITSCLESYAGLRLVQEVEQLERVKSHPDHPAVAIIGGAKIETKLPLIRALETSYDHILVGGKIANEALDQELAFSDKVFLPSDFDSEKRLDIGPKTIASFIHIIETARTIVWNGPLGKFEEKPYDTGTLSILQAILKNTSAFVVIGGGESLAVVEQSGVIEKIGFVSTGGGAMLEFLSGDPMPGLEVLTR